MRIVIKFGGAVFDDSALESFSTNLISLTKTGHEVLLVHGGGPAISSMMARLKLKPKFIDGLRVTDRETLDIVEMVLSGIVNRRIVLELNKLGGPAVGISGKDAKTIVALKKKTEEGKDWGYVGEVKEINSQLLERLLRDRYIPVVAPLGFNQDLGTLNVNADIAAAELAAGINAKLLIFATDVPGLLSDPEDQTSVINKLTKEEALSLDVQGGMRPKLEACALAVSKGVATAKIMGLNFFNPESIFDEKIGTTMRETRWKTP